jgi:aminopeptidase N
MHEKVKNLKQLYDNFLIKFDFFQAFPCFDEPNMQSTFTLILEHPQNSTIALSNNIVAV